MQITVVGTDAYKVYICKTELEKYIADYRMLDPGGEETLILIRDALAMIANKYQKQYIRQQMLAEFFPEEKGGCYLYLSSQSGPALKTAEEKKHYLCFWQKEHLQRWADAVMAGETTALCYKGCYYLPKEMAGGKDAVSQEFSEAVLLGALAVALLEEYGQPVTVSAQKQNTQKPK